MQEVTSPRDDARFAICEARDTNLTLNRPACPACGGPLMEIKMKLQCTRCRAICETCCEGGRG